MGHEHQTRDPTAIARPISTICCIATDRLPARVEGEEIAIPELPERIEGATPDLASTQHADPRGSIPRRMFFRPRDGDRGKVPDRSWRAGATSVHRIARVYVWPSRLTGPWSRGARRRGLSSGCSCRRRSHQQARDGAGRNGEVDAPSATVAPEALVHPIIAAVVSASCTNICSLWIFATAYLRYFSQRRVEQVLDLRLLHDALVTSLEGVSIASP